MPPSKADKHRNFVISQPAAENCSGELAELGKFDRSTQFDFVENCAEARIIYRLPLLPNRVH